VTGSRQGSERSHGGGDSGSGVVLLAVGVSIQFSMGSLACRLSCTCSNYEASTRKNYNKETIQIHKDRILNKQKYSKCSDVKKTAV
jgi:hypothetical protein